LAHPLRFFDRFQFRTPTAIYFKDRLFLPPPATGGGAVLTLGLRAFALALLQGTAEAAGLGASLDDLARSVMMCSEFCFSATL
jgi:hypothetical protein